MKCVCVLLYSRQQLEAANFLLKKRNGLERGVPQILRHLFTNKFISLNFVSLWHVKFFEQAWNDKVSNLMFVGSFNVPSLHNYSFFSSNFSADFQLTSADISWNVLKNYSIKNPLWTHSRPSNGLLLCPSYYTYRMFKYIATYLNVRYV